MEPVPQHPLVPDVSFDGGDLDCGGGLLLLIRRHIDPMERGGLLEILSTDASVEQESAVLVPVDRERDGLVDPAGQTTELFGLQRPAC
jgi:hypothetical protein